MAYFAVGKRFKNFILLVFSLLFYAWGEPKYVFLMMTSIFINYLLGLAIMREQSYKRIFLALGVLVNLGILFYFKYLGFAAGIVGDIFGAGWLTVASIVMPIGISFYTFQALSYLVDVYRDRAMGQTKLLDLGLYISMFPQLIGGPIIRYHDVCRQIENREHSWSMFADGIERFIVGFSKKILLANTMAEVADKIFALNFEQYGTYYAWLAIIAYTLQIYYDFSGYSDMAIGLGKMFGFTFLENFNYPYMATSMTDFWRRWHMSLSSWFRDYVYIPLGGNRSGQFATYRNLYIVFFLTGLWHGASFNFIIWGLGHGSLLVMEKLLVSRDVEHWLKKISLRVYTLLSVVILWVFFRVEGLRESLSFVYKLLGLNYYSDSIEFANTGTLKLIVPQNFYILLGVGLLFSVPWWRVFAKTINCNSPLLVTAKYICLICLFIVSLSYLAASVYNPFIYFRF